MRLRRSLSLDLHICISRLAINLVDTRLKKDWLDTVPNELSAKGIR
jgi:hypothetical protein